ncbi:MAG: DUF6129 family protein [Rhodocyclaceae bacterium]|nr:DUF6129 family protein [Rhodocyclaceae bacterium]
MPGIERAFVDALLAQIAVLPAPTLATLEQALREAFPDRRITVCSEDDIPPRIRPAAENAVGLIYYIAAEEHCLTLTNDATAASGIVVALRDTEEA